MANEVKEFEVWHPPPKERRRFQIHLSTMVMLPILGGVFLGLNFQKKYDGVGWQQRGAEDIETIRISYGWPIAFVRLYQYSGKIVAEGTAMDGYEDGEGARLFGKSYTAKKFLKLSHKPPRVLLEDGDANMFFDIAFAAICMIAAAYICERLLRRKIRMKAAQQ